MKIFLVFIFTALALNAAESPMILLPWGLGFLFATGIFFWGIYKTLKTQKMSYMLSILPLLFLIIGMFFI